MNAAACPLCNAPVLPQQSFCPRCEQLLSGAKPLAPEKSKWYHNVWLVLIMLFFVLGPLGLPLVWKNPHFSRWIKAALTLVMVAYTVALVQITMQAFQAVTHEMGQLNAVF